MSTGKLSVPSLDIFPEELLERILSLCVVAPPQLTVTRPAWHSSRSSQGRLLPTRLAPLLVNSTFYRIALPHYYHTIHLTTPRQTAGMWTLLRRDARLCRSVKNLVITNISGDTYLALRLCSALTSLDVTLDPYISSELSNSFCDTVERLDTVTAFTLRKQHNIYLTMPSVRQFMTRLAHTIECWHRLESVHLAFRLADDAFANDGSRGPISSIVHALSISPALHTFSTELPSLWNGAVLRVSQNPRLERIILGQAAGASFGGLYMVQARKHPRLAELIRNGTPTMRARAHTVICPPKMNTSLSEVTKGSEPRHPSQVGRHRSLRRGGRFD